MNIGIPKEIKAQEHRVSMIPTSAGELVKRGHRVFVQAGAGTGSSYSDAQYLAAGAEIVPDADAVYSAIFFSPTSTSPRARRSPSRWSPAAAPPSLTKRWR
jgi:alanine dehydrogenase